jgi:general stress protein 26
MDHSNPREKEFARKNVFSRRFLRRGPSFATFLKNTYQETAGRNAVPTDKEAKLKELLTDFNTAMLVTRTPAGELRSRPMVIADVEDDGTIWLMTQRNSPKMDEVAEDHDVNLSLQSNLQFVSISGVAMPIHDRAKIEEVWNESWKTWFPGGPDDPELTLLRIRGLRGEYWDNSGLSGIKYLIEAGKAYLGGTKPDVANDPKIHGKVDLATR